MNKKNSDTISKEIVGGEKREERYMILKKNLRFREAVEEDKDDVKSYGVNVFDLFDREGYMVIGMEVNFNMDKDDSIVNGV